ncbi:hypothetical protein RDABS01_016547 [Bienertia sinuspersici]
MYYFLILFFSHSLHIRINKFYSGKTNYVSPSFTSFACFMADANGKLQFVSGSIQPIDILSNNGVKYYVEFNEFHQPIRKGGHILVKFLGYIEKMAHYCPIGAITWHDVEKNMKVQIVNKMREHFIIPDDEVYDTLAQQHKKTHEQHYDLVPSGHSRSDWIKLVDHWFSPKGQKLSQIGKEARSLQCQVHTMGSNSYANLRADYDDAKAKVESLKLANSSCSSVDGEDEAFHDLMNGGDIPERPQGFGFGVKKSYVYGVRGLLSKEGSKKVKTRCVDFDVNVKKNEVLEKENRELFRKNDEYTKKLKAVVTQFSQILDVVRNGKASVQLIDAAQSALHMAIPEIIFLNFLFRGKGSRLEPALGEGGGGIGCRLVAVRGGCSGRGSQMYFWVRLGACQVKDDTSSGDGATTEIEDAPTKSRD